MKKIFIPVLLFQVLQSSAQNSCATALPVTAGTYVVSNIDGAGPPAACTPGDVAPHAEWFVYVPLADAVVTVTTDLPGNGNGDTNFAVFTGTCNALTCFSGDDDGGTLGDGYLSVATFEVTAGTAYYLAFDDRWSASGFTFQLEEQGVVPPVQPPITFTPVVYNQLNTTFKSCVVDLNGDYLDDIVGISGTYLHVLYQQQGGTFNDQQIPLNNVVQEPYWSVAAGDIDSNGYNDLIFGGGGGVTFLFADAGGTGYTTWNDPHYVFSQRTNFVDINNDGLLDAFVCHDVDSNVYFINQGEQNLVYHKGGLGNHPNGGNYGSVWVDYDNDGDQDLFIAKCRGGNSTARFNELHRNDGNGVFTDVSVAANMYDPIQTWSSCWYDFDNDGDMDAFIGASSSADGLHKLMQNNGDGTFTDITAGSNWDLNTSLSIEHLAYDFDNDGFVDILGGGGKIMRNNGDMTFSPYSVSFGPGPCGDLNGDGFIDVQDNETVYYNDGNTNRWIKLTLQGVVSNRNGIGARVELYGTWGKQIRDVRSGEGFRYMSSLNVHFGIGSASAIDSVLIKWPSGIIDYLYEPDVNSVQHVIEGAHPQADPPAGIAEANQKELRIFPNPATDWLQVGHSAVGTGDVRAVVIYSASGKLVSKTSMTPRGISVASLASGMYFMKLQLENGQWLTHHFTKL